MRWMAVALALAVPVSAFAESFLDKLLRIAGLTSAPGQMRGESVEPGDIWIATLQSETVTRLTTGGGYVSPVFSPADGSVFALKGETVFRIPLDGSAPVEIRKVAGAEKLVGFDSKNTDEMVILLDGGRSPLAVLFLKERKAGTLPYDPASEDQQRMLAQIRGQDRVYGTTSVYLKTERKQGLLRATEWTDIYLRRGGGAPQNVSRCDGVSCAQPALSPDGRRVAFVKSGG